MRQQLSRRKPNLSLVLWLAVSLAVGLPAGTWAAGTIAKRNLINNYPPPGQLVDIGGYKLHLACLGEGSPTVVLVAGLDDFSIVWSKVQPELAQTGRVCAYDRAGLGWSEGSPDPRTSQNMVRELHSLLVNAGEAGPYILVGHSFGGALVRLYAHDYPDEVAGIVFVDSVPDELFVRVPAWQKAIEQKLGLFRTLAPLSSMGLLALAPQSIPNRGFPEQALGQYRAISAATAYYQTGLAENRAFATNVAEVAAARVANFGTLPVVVLSRGYWDPMPGLSAEENAYAQSAWQVMQSELAALSTNSRQVIAEQSEHSIQLQQPDLVIEAVRHVTASAQGGGPIGGLDSQTAN